jgi:LysM repeat protein
MKFFRQFFGGILAVFLASGIVLGGFVLALAEEELPTAFLPSASPTGNIRPVNTTQPALPEMTATKSPAIEVGTETPIPTSTATATSTASPTTTAPPISCQFPEGWSTILVQEEDTLDSLAQKYGATTEALFQANCLENETLTPGKLFYIPRLQEPAPTVAACGPPSYWTTYIVQTGDTLMRISRLFRTTVSQLTNANCLSNTNIIAGQRLYVPNVPISTAPPIPTNVPTLQPVPTEIATPIPPGTDTPEPNPTEAPSPTSIPPSETPLPPPTDPPPTEPAPTEPPPPTEVVPTEPPPTPPEPTQELPTAEPVTTSSP